MSSKRRQTTMALDPKPAAPVRMLTTHEGKFLSLTDMRKRMEDPCVLDSALAMMKVGHERDDNPREVVKHMLGDFVLACGGERL